MENLGDCGGRVWVAVVASVCVCGLCVELVEILPKQLQWKASIFQISLFKAEIKVEFIFMSQNCEFFQLIYLIVQSWKHSKNPENSHQTLSEPRWPLHLIVLID